MSSLARRTKKKKRESVKAGVFHLERHAVISVQRPLLLQLPLDEVQVEARGGPSVHIDNPRLAQPEHQRQRVSLLHDGVVLGKATQAVEGRDQGTRTLKDVLYHHSEHFHRSR